MSEGKADKRAAEFLKHVGKLRRVVGEREKLHDEHGKAKTSKARKLAIEKRLAVLKVAVKECLMETKVGAKHVNNVVDRLKEAQGAIDREAIKIKRLEDNLGHPALEILKHGARIRAEEKTPTASPPHVPCARDGGRRGRPVRESRRSWPR
jgi:hypothetical protein